jgi:hypothetical protein
MTAVVKCSCGHFWSKHDAYGCTGSGCPCTRIDQHTRFDKATRTAVPNEDETVRTYDEHGEPHDNVLRTKSGKVITEADIAKWAAEDAE